MAYCEKCLKVHTNDFRVCVTCRGPLKPGLPPTKKEPLSEEERERSRFTTGFAVFYEHDFCKDSEGLKQVLSEINQLCSGWSLTKYRASYPSWYGLSNDQQLTPRGFEKMFAKIAERKYSKVHLSIEKEGDSRGDLPLGCSIDLFDAYETRAPFGTHVTVSNGVLLDDPTTMVRLIDLAKTIWKTTDGVYGFIVSGDRMFVCDEQLTAVFRTHGKTYTPEEECRFKEMSFFDHNKDKMRQFVRKASWGNLLNAKHVARLGGIKTFQTKAPCFKVEALPEGSAYLQLTETPLDFSRPDFQEKLKAFDVFLQPALIPGRPPVFLDVNFTISRL